MRARRVVVPPGLVAAHLRHRGAAGQAWVDALPGLVADVLERWDLRVDGRPAHGVVALVVPVLCRDGTRAAAKFQPHDPEHTGEAEALRAWAGDGAVHLLDQDPATGTLLLERLRGDRSLADVPVDEAVRLLGELLVRLTAHDPPAEIRPLRDVVDRMLAAVPAAAPALPDPRERALLRRWASAVGEVAAEAGNRLLHWDLHYENVLAGDREPWLAIDPKPLAGDPGFELLPALHNRWQEALATGDLPGAVCRRFDVLVDILGLDRSRAVCWTLARVLQNALWDVEDGATALDPAQVAIAEALAGEAGG